MSKTVFYASVGPALSLYDLDIEGATLDKRSTLTLPANIQYLWPHPSRRYFYVVSSTGGPGIAGDAHFASALRADPATGEMKLHGDPVRLPSRPIHTTVDTSGEFLLTAFNIPSNITVHRLNADGTIGALVPQTEKLDTGIFAHQVRMTPSNRAAVLVTRGNNAEDGKAEDPGAIKTYSFDKGVLKISPRSRPVPGSVSARVTSTFIRPSRGPSFPSSGIGVDNVQLFFEWASAADERSILALSSSSCLVTKTARS